MANQSSSGVGVWIAVVLLGGLAAGFGGMYFSQQSEVYILKKSLSEDDATVFVNEHGNTSVADIIAQSTIVRDERDKLTTELVGLKKEVQNTRRDIDSESRRAQEAQRKAEDTRNALKAAEAQIVTLRQQMDTERGKYDKTLKAEIDSLKQQILDEKSAKKRIEDEKRRLEEREQALTQASLNRVRELESEIQSLRQAINGKQQAIASRENVQGEQYDGTIIDADLQNKLAVINIGKSHNVHRGMQFSVIRWRLNHWVTLGTLEITKVDATTSVAAILDGRGHAKTCPKCGYVSKSPEELYCPFCSGGEDNTRVEPLVELKDESIQAMDPMNPILVGDYISNPFFSKKRQLKYVLTGEPVFYSPDLIKSRIQEYGGTVSDTVDIDTDYIVLGRIPDEVNAISNKEKKIRVDEYRKTIDTARQYGIPVIRESDLFDFLRN